MRLHSKRLAFASEDEQQHVFMVIDGSIVQWDPTVPLVTPSPDNSVICSTIWVRMDDNEERCEAIVEYARENGLSFPSWTSAAKAIEQKYPDLAERFVGQIQHSLNQERKTADS